MAAYTPRERKVGAAPSVALRTLTGDAGRNVTLDAEIFALEPNVALMHQVVNAQLAAGRKGTQSTKTRAEVTGGGSKPWRQKGTGRARQGSTSAPHFTGGGVALGPKPRSYAQGTPKKMIQGALKSALSDRATEGRIIVVDHLQFETPKTKEASAALEAWNIDGRALIVLGDEDESAYYSFRNLPNVHVVHERELNTFDVLRHDYVVFTEATLPSSARAAAAGAQEGAEA